MVTASTALGGGRARQCAAITARFLGFGCLLLGAGLSPAWGAPPPSVAEMLKLRPRQEGVNYTVPSAEEQKECRVALVKGQGRASGWVLKDGGGNLLRRFYDSNGDGRLDVWSYFKEGVEVYREVDTTYTGKADQYRWYNSGGSRWGVDANKDGLIDAWKVISPEEVSQEVLRAVLTRDFRRLQALLLSDAEIKALGLGEAQAEKLQELRKGARGKFEATIASLTKAGRLNPNAEWRHLETAAPECVPGDQNGTRADLVRHRRGTILFTILDKSDWIQTGPMIQVGAAWRLVDGPAHGPGVDLPTRDDGGAGPSVTQDPKVQKLVEELSALDKKAVPAGGAAATHLARADLLEKIVAEVKPQEREPWIRQVADSLSSAVQASGPAETTAATRLLSLEKQLVRHMPGAKLTGYVVFRRMQADYSVKIGKKDIDFNKVQQEWVDNLARFVQAYPRADDTPDALLQLGMVSEFLNKEVEAKNWYGQLKKNFPTSPQAKKADGAIRRLELEGKVMHLAGPTLSDTNTPYDIARMKGKVVLVYYWASWNGQCAADFAKLKKVLDEHGKALDLLCVNLDAKAEEAREFLSKNPAPGTHLYQEGGLEGRLATQYGVMVLPSLFVVGKDGKVLSRNAQISTVEEEVKKHLKK
jgi:thiol-disulfide isomerase/thioredoxin